MVVVVETPTRLLNSREKPKKRAFYFLNYSDMERLDAFKKSLKTGKIEISTNTAKLFVQYFTIEKDFEDFVKLLELNCNDVEKLQDKLREDLYNENTMLFFDTMQKQIKNVMFEERGVFANLEFVSF